MACQNGACVIAACEPDFADCNDIVADGCEVDTSTSEQHCGGCNILCTPDMIGDGGTDAERCLGGDCVTWRGTCPVGADTCADADPVTCNGNDLCVCYQSSAGDTRCGQLRAGEGACGECSSDVECQDVAPGAFCAKIGPNCPCDEPPDGHCIIPCP